MIRNILMLVRLLARWISLPVSPSAEQFSRIFFYLAQQVLQSTVTQNGKVMLKSIQ